MIADSPRFFPEPLRLARGHDKGLVAAVLVEQTPKTGGRGQAFTAHTPRPPSGTPSKAGPRRRLRHHSEAPPREEDKAITVLPIWLGSSTRDDILPVRSVLQIIPEDMHQHEIVMAIESLEADVPSCVSEGLFVEASESLEQAISLRREFLGDGHPDFIASIESYVVACNVWGVKCLNAGLSTVSLELLKKAEAMTEASNVPNFKRRVALRAATFNNLCCYFRSRGKANAALQYVEKALKIEQRYKEADNPARTQLNYAVILSSTGRNEEALEHIEAAVALLHDQERQLMCDEVQGDSEELRQETCSELVVAHYNMFVENLRLNRRAAGLECLQHAANIARHKLSESHPLAEKMQQAYAEVRERMIKAQRALPKMAATDGFRASPTMDFDAPMRFQAADAHPWQKADMGLIDSSAAQEILCDNRQIQLRKMRPSPQPPPRTEMQTPRRGMTHLKKHGQLFGFSPAISNEISGPWMASHPQLQKTEGFVGSPILTQQAHGVQPMTARAPRGTSPRLQQIHQGAPHSARGRMESSSPGDFATEVLPGAASTTSSWPPMPTTPGRPPLNPRPHLSGPESPELANAYEYHRQKMQMKASSEDSQAQLLPQPERLRAISLLRSRLNVRRGKGLPLPTDANKNRAATKIQARVRGYQARQWSKEELARDLRRQHVQERGHPVQGDPRRRVAFKVIYAARHAFHEYTAALKIQKIVRGAALRFKLRRQVAEVAEDAAKKLQAAFRLWASRVKRKALKSAARLIQARERGIMGRRRVAEMQAAARRLTAVARGMFVREKQHRTLQAAVQIQRIWRGQLSRRRFKRQKDGAVHIQRIARGRATRRLAVRQREAACRIAALWRGYYTRSQASMVREMAIRIQTFWKMRHARRLFCGIRTAASRIQGIRRVVNVRARVRKMKASAAMIKAASWRFMDVLKEAARDVAEESALIRIQGLARGNKQRMEHERKKAAVIRLQAGIRASKTRRALAAKHKAAVRMQAVVRGNIYRRWYYKVLRSTVRIQALFRGVLQRMQHQRLLNAVIRISSFRRGLVCRRELGKQLIMKAFSLVDMFADVQLAADTHGKDLEHNEVLQQEASEEQFHFDWSPPKTADSSQYAELESASMEDAYADIAGAMIAKTEFTYNAGELLTESEVLAADETGNGPPLPHGGDGSYGHDEDLDLETVDYETNSTAAAAVLAAILEIRCLSSMRSTPAEVEMQDRCASEVLEDESVGGSVVAFVDLDAKDASLDGMHQWSVDDVRGTSVIEGLPENDDMVAGQRVIDDALQEIGALVVVDDQDLSPALEAGANDYVSEVPEEDIDMAVHAAMSRVKQEIEDVLASETSSRMNSPAFMLTDGSAASDATRAVTERPRTTSPDASSGNVVGVAETFRRSASEGTGERCDGPGPRRHSWYSQSLFGPI